MRAHAASSFGFVVVLLLAGCASDATKAREALALGKTRAAAGALEQAGTSFAEAARLDPRLHEAFARLARVRLTQGRARDAEAAALRAASLAPRSSFYSELLARAQLAMGKKDGALASFEQAITLDETQTARLAFAIGVLREQMGKPHDAQVSYERAATADASAVPPRLALARLHLRADRLDLAQRRLAEVRAHVPAEGSERALFASLEARVERRARTTRTRERANRLGIAGPGAAAIWESRRGRDSESPLIINNLSMDQLFGESSGFTVGTLGSAADMLAGADGIAVASGGPVSGGFATGAGGGLGGIGTLRRAELVSAPTPAASPSAAARAAAPAPRVTPTSAAAPPP